MVFGGDVQEGSLAARRFVVKATADLIYLESQVFSLIVDDKIIKVEFKLCELPNDMKMLCFLGGELSNAATYFTTFANVCKDDSLNDKKSFGTNWMPFPYEKRVADSAKVQKKKRELALLSQSEDTKRKKITSFIASLKGRQEEVPLVQHFITLAKCDPLHLKNNVCKELFVKIWKVLFTSFPSEKVFKSYQHLPEDNIFYKFVNFVHKEMHLNKLSEKMVSWFNETKRGIERDFNFRFRGQESYAFLKNFPLLISRFLPLLCDKESQCFLLRHFYQLVHIRKLVSHSVRLNSFTQSDLDEMIFSGRQLFLSCCRFGTGISPSTYVGF